MCRKWSWGIDSEQAFEEFLECSGDADKLLSSIRPERTSCIALIHTSIFEYGRVVLSSSIRWNGEAGASARSGGTHDDQETSSQVANKRYSVDCSFLCGNDNHGFRSYCGSFETTIIIEDFLNYCGLFPFLDRPHLDTRLFCIFSVVGSGLFIPFVSFPLQDRQEPMRVVDIVLRFAELLGLDSSSDHLIGFSRGLRGKMRLDSVFSGDCEESSNVAEWRDMNEADYPPQISPDVEATVLLEDALNEEYGRMEYYESFWLNLTIRNTMGRNCHILARRPISDETAGWQTSVRHVDGDGSHYVVSAVVRDEADRLAELLSHPSFDISGGLKYVIDGIEVEICCWTPWFLAHFVVLEGGAEWNGMLRKSVVGLVRSIGGSLELLDPSDLE